MANFNEHALEMSIMELFKDEGYIHLNGSQIHRERTEVLLQEDLKQYLYINNQLRIPDGIVFVNGIPVVILEFKSAVKENTTIMDAYKQLTVRYRRDIPEIFKYNVFIVTSLRPLLSLSARKRVFLRIIHLHPD